MYDSNNPQLPTGPMHTVLDAAVGLFDVSGFSKIADRLEKEEAHAGGAVRVSLACTSAFSWTSTLFFVFLWAKASAIST